jgi:hypothetical protein
MGVKKSRNQFFACPALPTDKYGKVIVKDTIDFAPNLPHGCSATKKDGIWRQICSVDLKALRQA